MDVSHEIYVQQRLHLQLTEMKPYIILAFKVKITVLYINSNVLCSGKVKSAINFFSMLIMARYVWVLVLSLNLWQIRHTRVTGILGFIARL